MVARAVGRLGGVRKPSLAGPMLESANDAFLLGYRIEAAGRLREALRRYLAARCASHRLEQGGDASALFDRLRGSGVAVDPVLEDVLSECEEVIAMRSRGERFEVAMIMAFDVVGPAKRKGGAL